MKVSGAAQRAQRIFYQHVVDMLDVIQELPNKELRIGLRLWYESCQKKIQSIDFLTDQDASDPVRNKPNGSA